MDFFESVKTCFRKYFVFSGRASRSEFWWFSLLIILTGKVLEGLDEVMFNSSSAEIIEGMGFFEGLVVGYENITNVGLNPIFDIFTFIPMLSVASRRLHDTNRSAWWLLFQSLGVVSLIALAVYILYTGSLASIWVVFCGLGIYLLGAILVVWFALKGTYGPNRFGDDPLGSSMDSFD